MTTPCLPSRPPSTPLPPTHKLQPADPTADHIFLPGNPSTDLNRRTHSCTTWHGPHGLRGRVPPKRAEMKLMRGPSCSSSPRPWHLTTHSLSRNGANTEAPPHTQTSFPYQELTSEFNKVSLNTPLCSPPPEASVYLTWPQSESLVSEVRRVALLSELVESGVTTLIAQKEESVIYKSQEAVLPQVYLSYNRSATWIYRVKPFVKDKT